MTTVHDLARRRALVLRLKRVEGQLRGNKTCFAMVGCVIAQGDLPPDDVADMLSRFA